MLDNELKIHHKTRKSSDGKYRFSSLYLTVGDHVIGDFDGESLTELLCHEIEMMILDIENKKISENQMKKTAKWMQTLSFSVRTSRL